MQPEQRLDSLKILYLEDNEADFDLAKAVIEEEGFSCRIFRASNKREFQEILGQQSYDLILSDFSLPDYDGLRAMEYARSRHENIPFIMLSGKMGEELAIETLKNGATDYVLKDRIAALVPAIKRALREKEEREKREKAERALRESERFAYLTLNALFAHIAILNRDGVILNVNQAWKNFAKDNGLNECLLSENYLTICDSAARQGDPHAQQAAENIRRVIRGEKRELTMEYPCHSPTEKRWFNMRVTHLQVEGPARVVVAHENITDRKLAEQAVKNSEKKFRLLAENSIDCIWQTDLSLKFTYLSPSIRELTGHDPEEIVGTPFYQHCSRNEFKKLARKAEALIKNYRENPSARIISKWFRKDGSEFPIEINGRVLLDESGNPVGLQGAARDITERVESQKALRESEEQFRGLFENLVIGLYRTTPEGKILLANPTLVKMLGYDSQEELHHRDLNDGETEANYDREYFLETMENDNKIIGLESTWTRKDGSALEVRESARAVRNEAGKIIYYEGTVEDMTETRRAEKQLSQLASLVQQAQEAIVITDLDGNIEYVNPGFERISGFSRNEVAGQKPSIQKSGEHQPDFYKEMWETIAAGKVWKGEIINKRKDGGLYYEEAVIFPIKDKNGQIINYAAVKRDITSQKDLEKQFLRTQRMESIGILAGGIAHDLNNILSPILMAAELMRLRNSDQRNQKYLEQIETSAKRGADLVRQVLTFARGVEGTHKIVQLRHLLKEVRRILEGTLPKDIEISTEIEKDLWTISGDPTQLHQILMNLCVNARDAMPDGGELKISARNLHLDKNFIGMRPDIEPGNYVFITVKDTGSGIPKKIRSRIFEPFFTTKETGKGTGLGLSTVQAIVKSHHGFIDLETEENRGSHFKIYLKAELQAQASEEAGVTASDYRGNNELILVVDDESSIRDMTREILQSENYRILTARDGTEAVSLFADHRDEVNLVITDVFMPNMDGETTIQVLRKINPEVKIITVSGFAEQAKVDHIRDMNISAFLNKPYTAETLLQAVYQALREDHPEPVR